MPFARRSLSSHRNGSTPICPSPMSTWILVRAERAFAVVEVEEPRWLARRRFEQIQHDAHGILRHRDVMTARVQMTRVEPVPGAITQRRRHVRENLSDLFRGPSHRAPGTGRVFHQQTRRARRLLERVLDGLGDALR